jgi:asparagine synthase (glutamine-hydrolysing)
MLSGGIDSNIINYFLYKNNCNFENFTGRYNRFTSFEGDETFIGKQVSDLYNVGFNEVSISNPDFLSHIYHFVKCMNYPKQGSAVFSRYMVLKAIKGKYKVAFSGNGADEVFCGYPWLLHEAYTRKNIGISSSINFTQMSTSIFDSTSRNQHMFNKNQNVNRQQYYDQWHLYKQRYKQHDGFDYNVFTEDQSYCNLRLVEEFKDIRDVTAHEVRTWNRSILSAEDNVAMAHNIENRVPFLDHELVDFVFTIPEKELLPNGLMKGLLLKTMLKDLPELVVKQYFNKYTNEGKNVFIAPLTNWFVKDPKIKQFAYDILNSHKAKNRDYRIKQDITPETAPPAIWRLLVLELWHQHYIDRV